MAIEVAKAPSRLPCFQLLLSWLDAFPKIEQELASASVDRATVARLSEVSRRLCRLVTTDSRGSQTAADVCLQDGTSMSTSNAEQQTTSIRERVVAEVLGVVGKLVADDNGILDFVIDPNAVTQLLRENREKLDQLKRLMNEKRIVFDAECQAHVLGKRFETEDVLAVDEAVARVTGAAFGLRPNVEGLEMPYPDDK